MPSTYSDKPNPYTERSTRLSKVRLEMEALDLDALLLFTGPNLYYFSGMPCGRSGSRPFIYLLPCRADPVLIVHDGRQFEARQFTQLQDIRTYSQLSYLQVELVEDALQSRNLAHGRVGVEWGNEMVLDLPAVEFQRLRSALPEVEFVDASSLLWKLRTHKSDSEVKQIAKACEITTQAYMRAFQKIRAGMSEVEAEQIMVCSLTELGGATPWVLITSGAGNYDLVSKGGSPRTLVPGDMVWMDSGCSVGGYWSDFSRAGVVGGPSRLQQEAQEAVFAITQMGVDLVRPGVRVAEIAERCNEAVSALQLPVTSNISGLAARVGHGLGLAVTELPSLSFSDPTILEPGMVITIEPGVATHYGTFHIEQNVLVTAEGPQILSKMPWHLSVLSA
jgi:Xaa-Pro aminopeptidase